MMGEEDAIKHQVIKQAAELAGELWADASDRSSGSGDLRGLVLLLAVLQLSDLAAKQVVELGDDPIAMEFRDLVLKPLMRAVARLKGPVQ